MEPVRHIINHLFTKSVDQKTVHKLNKEICQLPPTTKQSLITEVKEKLRGFLTTDPIPALTTVQRICDGCRELYESLDQLLDDILLTCMAQLRQHIFVAHRTQSPFHVAVKVLYGILQNIFPQTQQYGSTSQESVLRQLHSELLAALTSDMLPSDCGLITATALVLLTHRLKIRDSRTEFLHVLVLSNKLYSSQGSEHLDTKQKLAKCCLEYQKFHCLTENYSDLRCSSIEPSYQVALLFHGLFNSGLEWMYFDKEESNTSQYDRLDDLGSEETFLDGCKGQIVKTAENETLVEIQERNTRVFLYEIYPLLRKLCEGAKSYCFQAFQILHMWLKNIRKLGNRFKKLLDNNEEELHSLTTSTYPLHPSQEAIFTFMSENQNSVFHLLNSNWENPAKGVSDLVYSCMTELLSLHEDGKPNSSQHLASTMLQALVSSDAWASKTTYPPLALAITHFGTKETLAQHPCLPSDLVLSLGVNHLAPAGTSVYKVFLAHLTLTQWSDHFLTPLLASIQSKDRLTRQYALSLWLPPTLRQYPSAFKEFLSGCKNTTGGWVAKMAILRVVRSNGLVDVDEVLENENRETEHKDSLDRNCTSLKSDTGDERQHWPGVIYCNEASSDNTCGSKAFTSPTLIPTVCAALKHVDENVRGEALAFLCLTRKASHPLSSQEANCLRSFFESNANIDSAPFRQGILKCYKALIVRICDSSAAELKKMHVVNSLGKLVKDPVEALEESSILEVNVSMLLWLIKYFHRNLFPDGNYQRRILALQLYKETLLVVYAKDKNSKYVVTSRYKPLCDFTHALSLSLKFSDNEDKEPVIDLALPWTTEALFCSCLDDMSDVREEAENILKVLGCTHGDLRIEELGEWCRLGLALISSPKASDVESGASVLVVAAYICHSKSYNISTLFEKTEERCGNQSLVYFMLNQVEEQFSRAKDNLLLSARAAPIHGSLLALGRCLTENPSMWKMDINTIQSFLVRLTNLMIEIAEFMLSKLACASPNGSAIAPSFAEMGQSVDKIIKECGRCDVDGDNTELECCQVDISEEDEDDVENGNTLDNALSADHVLVLACCWQTLKACCVVSGWCMTRLIEFLSVDTARRMTRGVVVRTLTSTRHKGAMEAARTAYSQICRALLTAQIEFGQMVFDQVEELLVGLREGQGTSITRRGAGAAMMVQAACGAAPRSTQSLLSNTICSLLSIAKKEVDVNTTVDAAPVLSLHLLQSLVLHAPLAPHMAQYLPAITATCLSAFTSHSWALRNAALQLYGAVVPRMVGQKKVRDDSSTFNSLTAPEFIARHQDLSNFLLNMLENSDKVIGEGKRSGEIKGSERERRDKMDNDPEETCECHGSACDGEGKFITSVCGSVGNVGSKGCDTCIVNKNTKRKNLENQNVQDVSSIEQQSKRSSQSESRHIDEMASIKLSSSLVPALSLVARLSPGTKIQHSSHLTKTLDKLLDMTVRFLASPVHTVRRLAALAVVTLTSTNEARQYIINLTHLLAHPESGSANWFHGNLLMLTNFLETYPELTRDKELKENLVSSLRWLCESNIKCYINANLTLNIMKLMHIQFNTDHIPPDLPVPGAAQYVHTLLKLRMESYPEDTIEMILMTDLLLDYDFIDNSVDYLSNCSVEGNSSWLLKMEVLIWEKLGEESMTHKIVLAVLQLLNVVLMKIEIRESPSSKCLKNLLLILQGNQGLKATSLALITVAHLLKKLCNSEWEEGVKHELILAFVERVKVYSASTSTEEYRLAATTALKICINSLVNSYHIEANCKEQLIVSCFQLLQDEDSDIRNSASFIVYSFLSTDEQDITHESVIAFHPNIAMRDIVHGIARKCVSSRDWSTMKVLWKICSGQLGEDSTMLNRLLMTSTKSYLFQSHTMNLYKEPKQVSIIVAQALVEALRENTGTDIPDWIPDEEAVLNEQGSILSGLISDQPHLYKHKQLVTATCVYIIACKTYCSMCEVFNISVKLSYPLSWKQDLHCTVIKSWV
ncbi:hypothetical protein Pcinc_030571 [Petrolisthes cinctipes]|uniref:DUF2428 domain-containing protein n=1 Tax=Petrolisthes cinctipes TaxID=88211 RepID=A0AAE1EXV1_PETCI|nr:hypothetical protein Pcinc_030571 [Petrolisthes cinctipes]